jgi:hypothetical protein
MAGPLQALVSVTRYWRTKLNVITPITVTAVSDHFVGVNRALHAAASATHRPLDRVCAGQQLRRRQLHPHNYDLVELRFWKLAIECPILAVGDVKE